MVEGHGYISLLSLACCRVFYPLLTFECSVSHIHETSVPSLQYTSSSPRTLCITLIITLLVHTADLHFTYFAMLLDYAPECLRLPRAQGHPLILRADERMTEKRESADANLPGTHRTTHVPGLHVALRFYPYSVLAALVVLLPCTGSRSNKVLNSIRVRSSERRLQTFVKGRWAVIGAVSRVLSGNLLRPLSTLFAYILREIRIILKKEAT